MNNIVDPNISYFWDFGFNNLTSNVANPGLITYTTNTDTVYTVTVYFISKTDTIKSSAKIYVFALPEVSFTNPAIQFVDKNVNFINNTTNANQYSWSFGDGSSSTAQNPLHKYANEADILLN